MVHGVARASSTPRRGLGYSPCVLSLLALILWMIAIPVFMGGMVWLGLGVGILAFIATRYAADRPDDMGTLFGLCLQAALVITVFSLIAAALP